MNEIKRLLIKYNNQKENVDLKQFLNNNLYYTYLCDGDDNNEYESGEYYCKEMVEKIDKELTKMGLNIDEDYSVYYDECNTHYIEYDIMEYCVYILDTTKLERILKLEKLQKRLKGE
jgi:hypothetical protein